MRRLGVILLMLLLLTVLVPLVSEFLQSTQAFTNDNLLRTTIISDSNL